MAHLNPARASILKLHRRTEADARAAEPPRTKRTFGTPFPRIALLDRIVERHRNVKSSFRQRLLRKLQRLLSCDLPTS